MLDNTEERWKLDDQVQPNRYCSRVSPVLARRSAAMVGASRSARRFAVSCPHCLRAGVFLRHDLVCVCSDCQHDELITSIARPNLSFVYMLRTASPARGASFARHFGQRSGWHARQKVRLQVAHGASAAGTTRCSASSHTKRGRWVEAVNSHAGGSSARANGFQSSRITRSALRRRICTVKR